jgi:hypothetical protein
MESGYLLVETHPRLPGMVRLRHDSRPPATSSPELCFAARFEDIDAAMMHAHEGLRRRLVDVNQRLYRSDVTTAVAIADAVELPHRRTYLAAELAADPDLQAAISRLHARHRRWERFFDAVGIAALILLLVLSVLGI